MIITQPPDAKLPSLVYPSFASSSQNPFAHSDDRLVEGPSEEDFSYPHTQDQRRSIALSELPPAYRPPSSISESKQPRKKRLKRKFKIALCTVLAIYVAACTIVVALLLTGYLKHHHGPPPHGSHELFNPQYSTPGYVPPGALPQDGTATICNAWSNPSPFSRRTSSNSSANSTPTYTTSLQYNLSQNNTFNEAMFVFINAGQYAASSGTLTVVSNDGLAAPVVDVTMKYRTADGRNSSYVCLMTTYNGVGLGLYTSNTAANEHPSYDITLQLPGSTFISGLSTNLAYFTQTIGRRNTIFTSELGLLSLAGPFSPIFVNGVNVTAQNVEAITSFSAIYGDFTTSQSLTLSTSQAAINVNVSLIRTAGESVPVALTLTTQDAIVQSNIFLMATQDSLSTNTSSPDFVITATSGKAPVSLAIRHDPQSVPSRVAVSASTKYAPVAVSLDALYEGSFSVMSDVGVSMDRDDTTDPTGMNRDRQCVLSQNTNNDIEGSIYWGAGVPDPVSYVSLRTQHAKAALYLDSNCPAASCLLSQNPGS
ncbi:hypothetical protein FRB94_000455 [Tulasnella sp. JGI-2019a]|nr:hypothetical protein FRB94_000455 [Tulasnella sp. JGI-2019a]KAG9010350.1 hypothetical protein FRB93_004189 [Tulasnella sp. JGI-2019a]KAG9038641.1 hypothetical protein FRB95_000230 [Tulasnella sp. JGI-2019a]